MHHVVSGVPAAPTNASSSTTTTKNSNGTTTTTTTTTTTSSVQLTRTEPWHHHHHHNHNNSSSNINQKRPSLSHLKQASSSSLVPTPTTELKIMLSERELDRYYTRLVENGFEDWDTFLEITDKDLRNMKFGSRDIEKLLKEIKEIRRGLEGKT